MKERRLKGLTLVLLTSFVISACGSKTPAGESSSRSSNTSVGQLSSSTSVSSASNDASMKSALDEVREKHPSLTFVEAEDYIVPGADYDSLPEEWQEVAKDPLAVATSLFSLGIIEFHEREDMKDLLKQNPDMIIPIVRVISVIATKIKTDEYDIDHLPPDEEAELRRLVDSLK